MKFSPKKSLPNKKSKAVLKIGVIGHGRMACSLVHGLLSNNFSGEQILMSSRPSNMTSDERADFQHSLSKISKPLERLFEFGVEMVASTEALVRQCRLVFLCCLPAHFSVVAKEIQPVLRTRTVLVCSCLAGFTSAKLRRMLGDGGTVCNLSISDKTLLDNARGEEDERKKSAEYFATEVFTSQISEMQKILCQFGNNVHNDIDAVSK